jgi:hypothetical protein
MKRNKIISREFRLPDLQLSRENTIEDLEEIVATPQTKRVRV